METCKSPRTVMIVAHAFADGTLSKHSSRFSRHDFTLPQLFACLILREMEKKSYRGTEALLKDVPEWLEAIGMKKAPDHATLHRAFDLLTRTVPLRKLMDEMIRWAKRHRMLSNTLTIDSTQLDVRYRSRHYEQRCRHHAKPRRRSADSKRSATAKTTPKLIVGTDIRSHLALSLTPRTGMGSDAPEFLPVLRGATARDPRLRCVLADAGFDSHENHRVAREELKIHSLIKVGIGRPTHKALNSKYRRRMQWELKGSQQGKPYGQRSQSEAFNSMFKRNLGDHLRSRTAMRRKRELSLRVVVHNLMIIRCSSRGSRLSPPDRLCLDPLNVRRLYGSAASSVIVQDAGWKPANRHGR
jgi:hypothetical protein